MHTHIIVNTGRAQVGPGETIVQCTFCTDGAGALGAFYKNPVAFEKVFKFC